MNEKIFTLLSLLADGRTHAGATLATQLGVTRGAVWARIQRLQALGVEVHAIPGKGYRLPRPFERLDAALITNALPPAWQGGLAALECLPVTDSTNERLLQRVQTGNIHRQALFADYQTAGRGRRGDAWLAPPGSGICVSLGWRFDTPPSGMGALGLAVGVAVAECVTGLGASGIALKWPNDVLHEGGKLAGILIEMRAEHGGPSTVVVGVGLNLWLPGEVRARIEQPVTDLESILPTMPSRNIVAARLLSSLAEALETFARAGFAPFVPLWSRHDGLRDRRVRLELPGRSVEGIARGVDAQGLLCIEHAGGREMFLSGHLRRAD
jgi:BirA family biotin operon repressor/biotin-[acetyl-CoA-carboxylase] ligase